MYQSLTNRHVGSPRTLARLLIFLVTTFAVTWLAFLPLILGRTEPRSPAGILLIILGGGAPSFTAVVLSAIGEGRNGLKRLWRGGIRWRVPGVWYLAILTLPGVASGAAWAVAAGLGAETSFNPWIPALVSGLLAGLLEEFGWSGYAFPAIQARLGFLWAGVAMGVIVAAWHLPFFLVPGTTQSASSLPVFLLMVIAVRIVFGWIYNGTGGSILLLVLLHAVGNAVSEVLNRGPMVADAPNLTAVAIYATAAVIAVLHSRRTDVHPEPALTVSPLVDGHPATHTTPPPSDRLTTHAIHHAREDHEQK